MDASGNVTATNTFGANGLISRHTASGSVFYTFDHQGSVVQRLDGSGSVLTSHGFDAYGTGTSTQQVNEPWGFGAWSGMTGIGAWDGVGGETSGAVQHVI